MGLTPYWIEPTFPGRLAIVPRPRGDDWLADDLAALRAAGINVLVSLLTGEEVEELGLNDEAKLSLAQGLSFISFPIPDRSVPASYNAVRELVGELKRQLTVGKAVGIHCRACIGRSALVAACLLVGDRAKPEEAFQRISVARRAQVPDTPEQVQWVRAFGGRSK